MLLDSINRLHLYSDKIPHLAEALAKLEEVKDAEPGRFEFEGGYLMIQTGVCKPDAAAHKPQGSVLFIAQFPFHLTPPSPL
jgi:hypothetical protein